MKKSELGSEPANSPDTSKQAESRLDTSTLVALYGFSPTLAATDSLLKQSQRIVVPDEVLAHLYSLRYPKNKT